MNETATAVALTLQYQSWMDGIFSLVTLGGPIPFAALAMYVYCNYIGL
jgi:hypothetical protein